MLRVQRGRDLRLHAGVGSNRSPAAPSDIVFNKVDLTTWSLGASAARQIQFTAGFNRQSKRRGCHVRGLSTGQNVTTNVSVRNVGFIYSLAYQF
jgi:hypothetical protein